MRAATSAMVDDARIDGCEPRYESRGWMHWPQHEDHSLQFQRLLGSAQHGAAYVSECFLTARRIRPGCDDSWCAEWIALAERTRDHAEASTWSGHGESARAAWLRATSYFLAARCFLPPSDRRWSQLYFSIEACAVAYLRTLQPRGRLVQIPYEDNSLSGYFLPARAASERAPVVLCCGGPYEPKENLLLKFAAQAIDRGLSLLLVDLPGQGATRLHNKLAGRHDVESAISACVDYLIAHPEADGERIAIYGDGLGAAYAARAASLDGRFAAAVCDGGAWDLRERRILRSWFFGEGEGREAPLDYPNVGRILCPFLMMAGDQDHLEPDDMRELHRSHRRLGADASLKIFSSTETGASHAQNDNPCIGAEFAFDWLTDRVGAASRQPMLETTTEE